MSEEVGFVVGLEKRIWIKIANNAVVREITLSRNALCDDPDQIIPFFGTWEGFWLDWDSLDDVGDITGYLF